jgi:hypothetical protein
LGGSSKWQAGIELRLKRGRITVSVQNDGEIPEQKKSLAARAVPEPLRKSHIMHILRSALSTTIGKIVAGAAFVGFVLGLYKLFVEAQQIFFETIPELHTFAAPSDFYSLPLSVQNRSHIVSIKIVDPPINLNCRLWAPTNVLGLIAIASVSFGKMIFGFDLQNNSTKQTFTWKNGKWFEGEIYN